MTDSTHDNSLAGFSGTEDEARTQHVTTGQQQLAQHAQQSCGEHLEQLDVERAAQQWSEQTVVEEPKQKVQRRSPRISDETRLKYREVAECVINQGMTKEAALVAAGFAKNSTHVFRHGAYKRAVEAALAVRESEYACHRAEILQRTLAIARGEATDVKVLSDGTQVEHRVATRVSLDALKTMAEWAGMNRAVTNNNEQQQSHDLASMFEDALQSLVTPEYTVEDSSYGGSNHDKRQAVDVEGVEGQTVTTVEDSQGESESPNDS